MKRSLLLAVAVAALGGAAVADAACDFDVVVKASGLRTSMIRAFAACSSSELPGPNTETSGGQPACEPVTPRGAGYHDGSRYDFAGVKGGCTLQITAKLVPDCSTVTDPATDAPVGGGALPAAPCHVQYVEARCRNIVQDDLVTPINALDDDGWTLATLSRMSLADPEGGDMTVIDFPLTFEFESPSNGSLKLSGNTAAALYEEMGVAAALPTCTQVAFIDATIRDPDGAVFATMGVGTATDDEAAEE